MQVLYQDNRIFVCIKPQGVVSTDQQGGLPQLVREYLGQPTACVRTVHRLDQVVGGVMVLARSREAARRLSAQVEGHETKKEYLAVVQGCPEPVQGTWKDLLQRDRAAHITRVVTESGKDARPGILHYRVLETVGDCSLVQIRLETGRTHQIRAQFAHHGHPLLGDRKYGGMEGTPVALWSWRFALTHPQTEEAMQFCAPPPEIAPWNLFGAVPRDFVGESDVMEDFYGTGK